LLLTVLSNGDTIHLFHKNIVVLFAGLRGVLSTSALNGGYREDLEGVFNNDCNPGPGMAASLKAPTYEEHLALVAAEMGLDPQTAAGLSTAAAMENLVIITEKYGQLEVTAIVTGGVEHNGGRAGDPASYEEKLGTINIILVIEANLPSYTLARALITLTEAKSAALQELMASSCYSSGIATGSGTDGAIIISNRESPLSLQDAGKHSKLGELIGQAVKKAVKEALEKQTGLSAQSQHAVFARLKRYGLDEEKVWQSFLAQGGGLGKADYWERLFRLDQKPGLLPLIVQLIHLLDELSWGLLKPEEVLLAGRKLLQETADLLGVEQEFALPKENVSETLLGGLAEILAAGAFTLDRLVK